jgi:hypothetical protein
MKECTKITDANPLKSAQCGYISDSLPALPIYPCFQLYHIFMAFSAEDAA